MSNISSGINSKSPEKRRSGKLSGSGNNRLPGTSPKINFADVFLTSPVPHLVVNQEGKILEANSGSCSFFGIEENQLKRNLVSDFFDGEGKAAYEVFSRQLGETGKKQRCELIVNLHTRGNVDVRLEGIILQSKSSSEKNIQLIIIDISEDKEKLQKLNNELESLKSINESKDKFFIIIAHSLKSPFQFLLSSSEMLFSEISELSKEKIKTMARDIYRSLEDLFMLLEDLLNWSRIQRGLMEFDPSVFNFTSLTNSLVEIYRNRALKKGISIINKLDKDLMVYADENMISSVMQNLLTNAIKFTQPDGIIILSSIKKNEMVEVSVFNTGLGIHQDQLKRLFKVDSVFSTMGTHGEKGTGIGLLLSKDMIEKNGGEIRVTSSLGKGCDFRFTLKTSRHRP